jgi:CRISPR system Cascade subunit CasD
MEVLLLRFEAPLMSFGAPIVDRHGVIQPYPALSMMTGLLGNALGYDHAEPERLERLQERLRYAVRQDRSGRQIQDYQTVDLSKPYMDDDRAWTTRGQLEKRKGGSASSGTHIRLRDYWADAIYTVALTLTSPDETPTLDALAEAVQHPARPLFVGRKTCLPAAPLYAGRTQADDLVEALRRAKMPARARTDGDGTYRAWWPTAPEGHAPQGTRETIRQPVTDRRDWENQIHVGERWVATGEITVTEKTATTNELDSA